MDIGQIQDVTDSLALMPDAALQKYAMMNKDDPYIMSLAMSENNRRQKLRAAQQGQAGQMPAPKVVDQAIASINPPPAPPPQAMPPQQPMPQAQPQLPEDQGIAQLPAPNMQGMADGGIAGYAPGGFAVGNSIPEGAMVMGNMYVDPDTGERKYLPGVEPGRSSMAGMTMGEALSNAGKFAREKLEDLLVSGAYSKKKNAERRQAEAAADAATAPDYKVPLVNYPVDKPVLPPTGADQGRGKSGGPSEKELIAAGVARDKAAAPDTGIGSPSTGESRADTRGGIPTLTTATTPADAAAELSAIKASQKPEVPTEIKSAYDDIGTAKRAAIDAEETQRQKDLKAMGPAFADREARLKTKQSRVDQQERDVAPMALMEAGFAMMSGTSPHALSNIGAGALIGTKTYKAGLDKIEDARDKLDDAFGRIEEFRRSESMMDAKEKRRYARELSDTFTETKKAYTDVLVKDWGVKQDDARVIYSSVVAERKERNSQIFTANENALNRASQTAIARLQASTRADPLAREREIGTNPTGAVARGYAAMKEENTAPLLFAQYEKAAKDPTLILEPGSKYATEGAKFKAEYPNAQAYVKAYRAALGSEGTIPPAGGSGFTIVGSRPAK